MTDTSLRIVVNGTDHSFQREVGCTCRRYKLPHLRGNTSVSLLAVHGNNEAIWHALIDAGSGAINNLFDNLSIYRGQPRVDQILLTHWHPDHTLGLNQLCEGLRRSRKRLDPPIHKIPLWCRFGNLWRRSGDIEQPEKIGQHLSQIHSFELS